MINESRRGLFFVITVGVAVVKKSITASSCVDALCISS